MQCRCSRTTDGKILVYLGKILKKDFELEPQNVEQGSQNRRSLVSRQQVLKMVLSVATVDSPNQTSKRHGNTSAVRSSLFDIRASLPKLISVGGSAAIGSTEVMNDHSRN